MNNEQAPRKHLIFAPREIFEQILTYSVIPTFDLVLETPDKGVILLKRIIAPYKDVWALPGLRMFKPELIPDTIRRIALDEVGVIADPDRRIYLGQFVGRFTEENGRQDLSTGYYIPIDSSDITINEKHFADYCYIKESREIPSDTGEMYSYYLREFFRRRSIGEL